MPGCRRASSTSCTASAAGAHLVSDERVGAVTFTGSNATGSRDPRRDRRRSPRAARARRQEPGVVLADADLDAAASIVARSSSQSVRAGVHRGGTHPRWMRASTTTFSNASWPWPNALRDRCRRPTGVTMGPLIDDGAVTAMERVVAQSRLGWRAGCVRRWSTRRRRVLARLLLLADGAVGRSTRHGAQPSRSVRARHRVRADRRHRRSHRFRQLGRVRLVGRDLHARP